MILATVPYNIIVSCDRRKKRMILFAVRYLCICVNRHQITYNAFECRFIVKRRNYVLSSACLYHGCGVQSAFIGFTVSGDREHHPR